MFKTLAASIALAFAINVSAANTVDVRQLTPEQAKEIAAQVAKIAESNKTVAKVAATPVQDTANAVITTVESTANKTVGVAANAANTTIDVAGKLNTTAVTAAGQWGELGTNMGKALISTAKELGQGVNEFSQTPVGKITAAVIVYKIIGKDILKITIGSAILLVGFIFSLMVWRRCSRKTVTYENVPRLGGLWISKKVTSVVNSTDDELAAAYFGSAALIILTLVVGLNVMF